MTIVSCRRGDRCDFDVVLPDGIDARYTQARFEVRDAWDESLPALLSLDDTSGIIIDHANNRVAVSIGASKTSLIPVVLSPRFVAAQLRLYASADDRVSYAVPFQVLPEVVNG